MPAYLSDATRSYNQIKRVHNDPIHKLEYYLSSPSGASSASSLRPAHADEGPYGHTSDSPPRGSSAATFESRSSGHSYSSKLMNLIRSRCRNQVGDSQASSANSGQDICDEDGGEIGWDDCPPYARRRAVGGLRDHRRRGPINYNLAAESREEKTNKKLPKGMTAGADGQIAHFSPSSSPLESSGFSEGTPLRFGGGGGGGMSNHINYVQHFHHQQALALGRANLRHRRGPAAGQLVGGSLEGSPLGHNKDVPKRQVRVVAAPSSLGPDGGPDKQQQQQRPAANNNRQKRRKITRINRRMLRHGNRANDESSFDGGGRYASSAYALSELFSQSEIPGFREIFASDSYLRKFCWIVAFLFMTVLSLNDMTELITEYYEYPITVDVRLRDSARLPFPAVTVCNLNAVRFSALCSNSRFELASQIPSELRDRLCGIQVEKKKQGGNQSSSDSDISDINNIGITTTTTTTTSTTTTTTATSITSSTSPASQAGGTQAGGVGTGAAAAAAAVASTSAPGVGSTPASRGAHSSTPRPSLVGSTSTSSSAGGTTGPMNGDNEDELAHELLQEMGRRRTPTRKFKRSHQLNGERPFVSKRWALRLNSAAGSQGGVSEAEHRDKASQFNGLKLNNVPVPSGVGGQTNYVGGGQRNQHPHPQQPSGGPQQLPPSQSPAQSQFPMINPLGGGNQPTSGGGGGGGGSTAMPGGNKNNQNTAFNFMPAAPNEDFELTERQEREVQENLTNWLAVMYQRDPQLTRSLGHQFDDMILRCTMKSINCTRQRAFENSFSPTEGNCFTFRSRVKRRLSSNQMTILWDTYEEANLAGTSDGLELVLNLEKNEYISGSSQVGALVMIHHPSDQGYAASEATFVAPEFTTYIGLKMVNVTRLPAPYPEYCVDSWPAKFADTLTRNSTYSQQACLKTCLQKTIQTQCKCQSAFLPIVELDSTQQQQQQQQAQSPLAPPQSGSPDGAELTSTNPLNLVGPTWNMSAGVPSASFLQENNKRHSARTARAKPRNPFGRQAHLSSAAQSGSLTSSNASSNSPGGGDNNKQQRIIICDTRKQATRQCVREVNLRAADRVHNCECPPKCQVVRYDKTISMARWPTREDKVSFDRGKLDVNFQNLAKVIVYFQTMTCEEIQQQAVFNAAKLFSALGGIMGMYVGFSFLSVFEIFEVMSRKFWHYLSMRFLRTQRPFTLGAAAAAAPNSFSGGAV